jgi:hypothetical protein
VRNRRCRRCLGLRRVAASLGGIWTPALLNAMSSRPNPVDGRLDGSSHLVLVGDVTAHAEHGVARRLELAGRGGEDLLVEIGEHDGGASAGERAGGGQAHPGAGAGDEGDLAAEVVARV